MTKCIVPETVTKPNDEDNINIKTEYIDNFVTVDSNYGREKMVMETKQNDKDANGNLCKVKLKKKLST